MLRELGAVAELLARGPGRAVLARALPLYLTTGIVAFILFAGNGIDARTLTELCEADVRFRWLLLAAWSLASLPAARAWLAAPDVALLRALPVSRSVVILWLGLGCCAIELPWAALWLRGARLGTGSAAVLAALAFAAAAVAGVRSVLDAALWGASALAWTLGTAPALGAVHALVFVRGIGSAWSRLAEPSAAHSDAVLAGPAWLSLTSALAVATSRAHRAALLRSLVLALAAAALPALHVRRNAADLFTTALFVWGPVCVVASLSMAGPVLDVAARFGAIVRSTPKGSLIRGAPRSVLALGAAAGACAFTAIITLALGLRFAAAAALGASLALYGSTLSLVCLELARRMLAGATPRAGRLVLAGVAACGASTALVWLLAWLTGTR